MSTITEMTDEERLELVERCTLLLRLRGRKPDIGNMEITQYFVEGLAIIGSLIVHDSDLVVPCSDQGVVERSISLVVYRRSGNGNRLPPGNRTIFRVPHRTIVRPSVLKDYMWPRPDLGAKALITLRNIMVLDDLAAIQ